MMKMKKLIRKIKLAINLLIFFNFHLKKCNKQQFKALLFKKHYHRLEDFYL